MKYCISIEETVVGNFEVEANSKEEAFEIAKEKYYNCEFVNEPGELLEKRMRLSANNDGINEWEEF